METGRSNNVAVLPALSSWYRGCSAIPWRRVTAALTIAVRVSMNCPTNRQPKSTGVWSPVRRDGQEGIALLVIMVVFVVLYLVIYQLYFSTKMEEHIAQSRYGESESTSACYSAGLFVITLLVEDLTKSSSQTADAAGASTAAAGASGGIPKASDIAKAGRGDAAGAGGTFSPLSPDGSGSGKNYDSLFENIFNPNVQQVGDISVKITLVDGERVFDLNQLFNYPTLEGEEVSAEEGIGLTEGEMVDAVTGAKDSSEAGKRLLDRAKQRIADRKSGKAKTSGSTAKSSSKEGIAKVGESQTGELTLAEEALSDYEEPEFEIPDPLRVEAATRMVERAILMMFSINENQYGYRYSRRYDAAMMAQRIVEYVLARRSAQYQNRIYLVSELLNLSSESGTDPADITPEIFYGPWPRLTSTDEVMVGEGFVLRRDEFNDIVPEYVYDDAYQASMEEEQQLLSELQQQFGQFADFGGMGLGRLMGNPLTRGMHELPRAVDENGEEYVVEVPRAIGLKDLFTTYSTGKINLNTVAVPVLFGLLLSLSEDEANTVALNVRDYRQRFQQEADEAGVEDVKSGSQAPDLGQPKRKKKDETTTKSSASGASDIASAAGLDPALADSLESSYQDLELNYFTSIEQIELVDGTDEGRDDLIRKDEGVKKVTTEENDSLYNRILHDLNKVKTFSSTYFNAELKAKPKNGASIKTGYLTVRRDTKKKMVDVVLWKNLQK
jgi:hypothetical protein